VERGGMGGQQLRDPNRVPSLPHIISPQPGFNAIALTNNYIPHLPISDAEMMLIFY